MSKHVTTKLGRRGLLVGAVTMLVAGVAVVSFVGTRSGAEARSDVTPPVADVVQTFACDGSELQVSRTGAAGATLTCISGAPVTRVGDVKTISSVGSGTASTALPTGTDSGDLLVATVQVPSRSRVSMKGWTKAYDVVSKPAQIRLVAWWRFAGAGEGRPTATVAPAARVSMMTVAFSGTATSEPVLGGAQAGTTVPSLAGGVDGGRWLMSLAVQGHRVRVAAPRGAAGIGSITSGRTVRTVLATAPATQDVTPASRWRVGRVRTSVAGLLRVNPRDTSASPATPVDATKVAPGTQSFTCPDQKTLEYQQVGPTVVKVTCRGPEPTSSPPSATNSPEGASSSSGSASASSTSETGQPIQSSTEQTSVDLGTAVGRPSTPPAKICGDTSVLTGPATAPAGAVVVAAGDNAGLTATWAGDGFSQPGKTFWFAPGVHTLGGDKFSQIIPGDNTTFIGAPGAIIDGQNKNLLAFTQTAKNVTIKYLTIRNFGTGKSNNDQGVVNHDRGDGWTITNNVITQNDGAGVMLGPNSKTTYNCLKDNGQYGYSAVAPQGETSVDNVLLDHNEIVGNNTDDWEKLRENCGCTGAGKFWEANGAVVTNNYIHDNKGSGIWVDFNNRTFLIEGNWIENNDEVAILYEISYNFMIRNNVMIRNALVAGKAHFGGVGNAFPAPAIYISESGGDSRAGSKYAQSEITGNYFEDNWDGIALWENADRFCRPGETFDSTNSCPFFDQTWGTRNRTQNIRISNNDFKFTKSRVGCTNALCGRNAVFSNYGTVPASSPYKGTAIQQAITFDQNNVWANNRYVGEWHFMAWDMATDKTFSQWRAAPYRQDAGSTM